MAKIWLTYAWKDNDEGDIDFIAQELVNFGLEVKLDRWNIEAGKRLWEQINNFIQNPIECDAWGMYVTQNSLGSEPCKEEFAYALERALKTRGNTFPIIGISAGSIDGSLIPGGIKTRLYVNTSDPDWKERTKAAAEGRSPSIPRQQMEPYFIKVHLASEETQRKYAVEVRPRTGSWSPFIAGIPIQEKDEVKPYITHGPRGQVPNAGILFMTGEGADDRGDWWVLFAQNEATPSQSYYIFCDKLPSKLIFGAKNGLQYSVMGLQC